MANEHIFNNSIIVTGSISSSVGFFGDGTGLTGITAVAEWDGSRNGDASITGSLIISGSGVNVDFTNTTGVSGSFSGSFSGDGSGLTGISTTLPAGVVSGSAQISYTGITDVPANIISSSAQFTTITSPFTGSFTGSFTGDGSNLTNLPTVCGLVSGSAQISYTGITDVPAGIVSSSAQFTSLTSPFTGSFTGSFIGDGSGLTGITATAVGGIFQTGSATGAIKTNDTSYTSIASGLYSFAGGGQRVTASADYATALGGFETQATATYATVIGGGGNEASNLAAIVAGGITNAATGSYSSVLGGNDNCAKGDNSTVVGGLLNIASGSYSAVIGGRFNTSKGIGTAILASSGSTTLSSYTVIAGGLGNSSTGEESFIGGGLCNTITKSAPISAIIGGSNNNVAHSGAVILGGSNLTTSRDYEAIATTLTVSGSGTNLADAKLAGIMTLANRTATPTSAPVGALMTSGSNLYFYGASGWVQIN